MFPEVSVDRRIWALRPDFRLLLLAAHEVRNEGNAEQTLREAEDFARRHIARDDPAKEAHIAAWRDAFAAFGAKPKRTASSVEALVRRAIEGPLPRINPLVDLYNAVSVRHLIPVGGEDLHRFEGVPTLTIADGTEPFQTTRAGESVIENPERGEVIWRDAVGVTCRRWNWRQGTRTRITGETKAVLFILESLDPYTQDRLEAAGDALEQGLRMLAPQARIERKVLAQP